MELILFLPLIVSIVAFFIPKNVVKEFALAFSLTFLLFTLSLVLKFDRSLAFNFKFYSDFLLDLGGSLNLALDGLGLLMVILTNFVVLMAVLLSWSKNYNSSFYGFVFLMQFALIGVFSSLNALVFYFFWELALLPIYFIIYRWGSGENLQKVFTRFFMFTFVGSLFILAAFIILFNATKTSSFDFNIITPLSLEGNAAIWYTICLAIGFGVKIPMFLLHSWQSDTYTDAPAEGTMLLSGIMLKMGLYGWLRWGVQYQGHLPECVKMTLVVICVAGVLYGAHIAMRRNDLKRIMAFSSLSHVNLILAGIFTLSFTGFQGSIFQMVAHGINIVGLFYVIDLIEQQTKTRDIHKLGGIATQAPYFSTMAFLIVLGSIAVPLTNGFPGEFLLLFSVFSYKSTLGVLAGISIIYSASYMLRFYSKTFFGEVSDDTKSFQPVATMHNVALSFIGLLIIILGLFPQLIMNFTTVYSQYLANILEIKP